MNAIENKKKYNITQTNNIFKGKTIDYVPPLFDLIKVLVQLLYKVTLTLYLN